MKNNQVHFAIIPREPSASSNEQEITKVGNDWVTVYSGSQIPEEITKLLNEYKDIVVEDIPNGLPPMRSIIYCMDLNPGASFLNKALYRLTSTKNEELNRQVHELL